jgi:hypothetical protein
MKAITVERLTYLSQMLAKYHRAYYRAIEADAPMSNRMYRWTNEYDYARDDAPDVWAEYCKQRGFFLEHDSRDCMA